MKLDMHIEYDFSVTDKYFQNFRSKVKVISHRNDFNGVNVAKHWHVAGEVFAISDCLVKYVL